VDLDEIVENAVISHCEAKGYSEKLTKLMVRIAHKHRKSDVQRGDLGNFLQQVNTQLKKEVSE